MTWVSSNVLGNWYRECMTSAEMEALLNNIAQMSNVVYAKEPHWNQKTMELLPPATAKDVAKLSKLLPIAMSPLYHLFLRLHNGCLGFWGGHTFLGSKGKTFDTVTVQAQNAMKALGKRYMVFSANGAGEFLLFNAKKKNKLGDYEVLRYSDEVGVEDHYPDFGAFLGTTAYLLQTRILDKGYSAAKQRRAKKKQLRNRAFKSEDVREDVA